MMMMVVLIDPLNAMVDFNINGIPNTGSYQYSVINRAAKNKDTLDLADVMKIFGQGGMPRF
jgi:hypothetical protein